MARILGIDPGSRITGYGVVDWDGSGHRYVDSGCIRVPDGPLADRLGVIFESVRQLVASHRPEQLAIERVFVNRNADSALKLGQARGAAICAGVVEGLPVSEYTPREIKLAIVGRGGADKVQVQHMVKALLELNATPQADAADALAVALCHSHTARGLGALGAGRRRGRRVR